MSQITMKELLEAGVHFGHQSRRWNPKMNEYIFMKRKGIHIIDLQKTLKKANEAGEYLKATALKGGTCLFVGTKKQAQQTVIDEAVRCKQFYIAKRWPGGLLTNFKTIQQSIKRLKKIEEMEETGEMNEHSKKIQSRFFKEKVRLLGIFGGVKEMKTLPSVMIIVDVGSEQIALAEAKKMNIPVVAVVDTDSDPTVVDYAVPGNDDAIRAISLFVRFFSDTISEGVQEFEKSRLINKDKEPETAGDTVAADADPENREKSQTAAATEDISEDMIRHQHEIDEISEKFENEIFPDAEEKIK